MLLRLAIILVIAIPAWYYADMDSPSRFLAYVLPIVLFACVIAFCLWLIKLFEQLGQTSKN